MYLLVGCLLVAILVLTSCGSGVKDDAEPPEEGGVPSEAAAEVKKAAREETASPTIGTATIRDAPWQSRGIGGGGALYSASISPHDPEVIFVTTDMSAVFRTGDFGRSWRTIPFQELQGGVDSHVRFTASPSTLYSAHLTEDGRRTPMRSADGGETWSPLQHDPTDGDSWSLHADPSSTERIIVSGWDTLYFSNDGGTSFSSVYSTSDEDAGLHVAGAFWDGDSIFVATIDGLLASSDGGVRFSLSPVGGIPADEAMASFAGARENGRVRFFAVTLEASEVYPGMTGADMWGSRGIYRLDWDQGNWTSTTTGIDGAACPFFVAMALNDADVAYVAGGNTDMGTPIVYKTNDGGSTWTEVFHTESNQNIVTGWCGSGGDLEWWWPELALGFAVSPSDPDRAIITDFGFAHVTDDGGTSWRQAYVDPIYENPTGGLTPKGRSYGGNGLENTSAWWLHWIGESTLIAAFADIQGIRSQDGGHSWTAGSSLGLPHNTTYHIAEHPMTGTLYAATSSVHDMYESTYLEDSVIDDGEGHVVLSNDEGKTWQLLKDFGHPVIWLAIDSNDPETMYASVIHSAKGGIYVTHNLSAGISASWQKLSSPPRTEGHPFNILRLSDGTLVATYSGRINEVGSFTESSGVFLSIDDGATWEDRSDPGMMRWTKDVVVDPHDPSQNTWYVSVFSHWGSPPNEVGGLYRTADRGVSWARISDLYRVESCTIHPDNPGILYLSTESRGLWRTNNLTDASPAFSRAANYPFRHPVRIFFNVHDSDEIWATSFGGGLMIYTASTP